MPTATHSWARDGQRRQTSVQQVCNKYATSVQQVWYLLRGVIELAAFAKPTVARLDEKLTVWLSGPCAHHAQTRTITRRAPHARASPEGDRRRQRGGRRETKPANGSPGREDQRGGAPGPACSHGITGQVRVRATQTGQTRRCGARAHTHKHPCTEMPAVGSHATCAAALL
jgi:hypothetical protein